MTTYPTPKISVPLEWPSLLKMIRIAKSNLLEIWPEEVYHNPVTIRNNIFAKCIILNDANLVHKAFVENREKYQASRAQRYLFKNLFGRNNLIVNEGEDWEIPRRPMDAQFGRLAVDQRETGIASAVTALVQRIAATGPTIQIDELGNWFAWRTAFAAILSSDDEAVIEAVWLTMARERNDFARVGVSTFLSAPEWLPPVFERRQSSGFSLLRQYIDAELELRLGSGCAAAANGDPEGDLLARYLALRATHGDAKFGIEQIRQNLIAAFATGHDTSALTIAWAVLMLALHPPVLKALRTELNAAAADRPLRFSDFAAFPLLNACVNETLRLYPPLPFMVRECTEPHQLGDYHVARGTNVILISYVLHRHQQLWEHPDEFRPDRFLDGKLRRGNFLPFGLGPRVCPGQWHARQQVTLAIAEIVRNFAITLPAGDMSVKPVLRVSLRPEQPISIDLMQIATI